jgi:hypothetical protein
VLIPRPETEALPELAAAALSTDPSLADLPWADLGTGSGAIALALAAELGKARVAAVPAADSGDGSGALAAEARAAAPAAGAARPHPGVVFAVDVSPVALRYATHNARAHGMLLARAPRSHHDAVGSTWGGTVAPPVAAAHDSSPPPLLQGGSDREARASGACAGAAAAAVRRGAGVMPVLGSWLEPQVTDAMRMTLEALASGCAGGGSSPSTVPVTQWQPSRGCDGYGGLQGQAPLLQLGGVLSNPPYVPRADMVAGLQAEVFKPQGCGL